MILLVFLIALVACGDIDNDRAPEYRGIEGASRYRMYGQRQSMLLFQSLVEGAYGVRFGDLFAEIPDPFWVITKCPHDDDTAVVYDGKCYHGLMFSCDEIYVAVSHLNPQKTCGTALIHEYAHCLSYMMSGNYDGAHLSDSLWSLAGVAHKEACARDW
jgi:hypothetical protein